jgi:membrane protein DedA with SNARE-associated domain
VTGTPASEQTARQTADAEAPAVDSSANTAIGRDRLPNSHRPVQTTDRTARQTHRRAHLLSTGLTRSSMALIGWGIGRAGGRPLLERHGNWFHLSPKRLDRAQQWFERWGQWSVLLGRNVPLIRSFISIPAGVFRMPLGRYILLTLIGSAIWAFALAGMGYALGTRYGHFDHAFRYLEYAVVVAVIGIATILTIRTLRRP